MINNILRKGKEIGEYRESKYKIALRVLLFSCLIILASLFTNFYQLGVGMNSFLLPILLSGLIATTVAIFIIPPMLVVIYENGIEIRRFRKEFIPWENIIAIHFDAPMETMGDHSTYFRIESKSGLTGYIDPAFMKKDSINSSVGSELLTTIIKNSHCKMLVGKIPEIKYTNKYVLISLMVTILVAFVYSTYLSTL